jgi:hypothetical protein
LCGSCKCSHIDEYAALSKTPHALADGLMLVSQHPGKGRKPMMTLIYRLLVVVLTLLVVLELFSQKDLKSQATAALVLIPFVLRALMIA